MGIKLNPVLQPCRFLGHPDIQATAGSFSLGLWSVQSDGEEIRAHGHQEAHFMFVKRPRFRTQARETDPDTPTLLIFNPPDTFHADHYAGGHNRFFSISLPRTPSFDMDEFRVPDAPVQIGWPLANLIVWRLINECVLWGKGSALAAEALCFDLLGVLGTRHGPDSMRPVWLNRASEMFREQGSEAMSIESVSREVDTHPVHLTRTFRKHYGCTPGAFIRFYRLKKAAALLAETNLPLAEIALESGFADQSHFTHHFRDAFGIPPGRFRRTVGPFYI